jgi:hypothetical protein
MTLSDIDAVRLKSSDRSTITREQAMGDDTSVYFKLGHAHVLSTPDIEVRVNNIVISTYTTDYVNGIVTFDSPPTVTDEIEFVYYWSIFTDEEVDYFLSEAAGNVTRATARLLLAIAADAAKVAQRESQAGGGGLGAVSLDTSVTARELRATAKALIDLEGDIASTDAAVDPAEGLTEPAWTEAAYRQGIGQDLIRHG